MPIVDENTRPVTRQSSRLSKGPLADLNDAQKMVEKRSKLTRGLGARRAVLGDVTNRQAGHVEGSKHALKKASAIPVMKTRVIRKPSALETYTSPPPLKQKTKVSPMCISNDLDEMSLGHPDNLYDIDREDAEDEFSAWQYAKAICSHFFSIEASRKPHADYMSLQVDINSKMRAILVDWIVDVHSKYRMVPQTLHMAINIMDRYLTIEHGVLRQYLQLVGVTSLFIAAKYEEIYPPDVEDFVKITDNAYQIDEVFQQEEHMLKTLGYRLTSPTAYQFLQRFLKAAGESDERTRHLAHYFIDRSMQEVRMLKYLPSQLAAAAVFIARKQMGDSPTWHATLEHHTRYSQARLAPCVHDLCDILWSAQHEIGKSSKLTAVKRKFSKPQYLGVSGLPFADTEHL